MSATIVVIIIIVISCTKAQLRLPELGCHLPFSPAHKLRTQALASTLDPEKPGRQTAGPTATSDGHGWQGPGGELAGGGGRVWSVADACFLWLGWWLQGPGQGG